MPIRPKSESTQSVATADPQQASPNSLPQPPQLQGHKTIVPAPQIPQLTDLGERLAKDKERTYLESLLEGLSEKADERTNEKTNETTNSSEVHAPLPLANKPGSDTREEAIKSARHILQTVWSMQHIDKLQPPTSKLQPPPNPTK